jgi:serine/threonine protein kinase
LAQRLDGQFSVKILDFGIAKRLHSPSPALTDPGRSLGSPWYMSPEQMLTPASVDPRADVWSLGVLLFELLTARLPFEGESVPQVCANVLAAAPLRLGHCRGDLAPELDTIVLCCLEKEPSRRFESVSELSQALSPFGSLPATLAPPLPLPLHAGALAVDDSKPSVSEPVFAAYQPRRPRRLAIALVAAALLALVGWLQYRDPSLAAHAIRAALGTSFGRAGQPSSRDADSSALDRRDAPPFLQYLHTARANPEREAAAQGAAAQRAAGQGVAAQRAAARLAAQQARARAAANEEWQRAQAVKRLNDEENKYGL